MRTLIITLSFLILSLSVLIIVKALQLPERKFVVQENPDRFESREYPINTEKPGADFKKRQAATRTLGEKLPTPPANTEAKSIVHDNEEIVSKVENRKVTPNERVLAILDGETFESSQVVVDEGLARAIRDVVREIVASPSHRVIIEGHTDNVPVIYPARSYSDNMGLSTLRAKGVAEILIQNGVPRDHISVIGYGDTRPIDTNDTISGRAKNRRVEIKIISND